jgi:hypothetical protein
MAIDKYFTPKVSSSSMTSQAPTPVKQGGFSGYMNSIVEGFKGGIASAEEEQKKLMTPKANETAVDQLLTPIKGAAAGLMTLFLPASRALGAAIAPVTDRTITPVLEGSVRVIDTLSKPVQELLKDAIGTKKINELKQQADDYLNQPEVSGALKTAGRLVEAAVTPIGAWQAGTGAGVLGGLTKAIAKKAIPEVVAGAEKAGTFMTEKVAPMVKKTGNEFVDYLSEKVPSVRQAVERGVDADKFQLALELTSPKITPKVKQIAIDEGRFRQGWFKGKIEPNPRGIAIAEEVAKLDISATKSDIKNVEVVRNAINTKSLDVESGLLKYGKPYKEPDLISLVKRVEGNMKENSDILFAGDKSLENAYRSVANQFLKNARSQSADDLGLWNARKMLDKQFLSTNKKGFTPDTTMTVKKQAINDIRNSVNEFIESRSFGANYADNMSSLNKLYGAMDNMSDKFAAKSLSLIGDKISKVGSVIKSHSAFSLLAGAGIVTGGMITPVVPVLAGIGIGGYGLFRASKFLFKEAKPAVAKLLKFAEEKGLSADVQVLKEVDDTINSYLKNQEYYTSQYKKAIEQNRPVGE